MLSRELSPEKQERWVFLSPRVHTFVYVYSLPSASRVDVHENLKLLHQSLWWQRLRARERRTPLLEVLLI